MAKDLILRGNLSLGSTPVEDEVTAFILKFTANDVNIPATLTKDNSHAPGARKYTIQIDYLSTDGTDGTLFPILWEAVLTETKELAFSGRMRNGAVSVSNPQWDGVLVVSAADLGGEVENLSTGSLTCTMTGEPVRSTS